MVSRRGLVARLIHAVEWLATRVTNLVLLDTQEHARHVAEIFGLAHNKVRSVWVGVEDDTFRRAEAPKLHGPVKVLFYGQFIPLHGLDTIVDAIAGLATRDEGPNLRFTIVGTGQEAPRIDAKLAALNLANVERIQWVDYTKLPALIAASDICLGVFASGGKAARVIPNKVFQILAVGRPLVTMDSPAIREIIEPGAAVRLVRPGDSDSLADAIVALAENLRSEDGHRHISAALEHLPLADVALVRQHLVSATETL
nr:glycosyltransferase [Novosphingobium taihuense]